jgi:hypothetical protein
MIQTRRAAFAQSVQRFSEKIMRKQRGHHSAARFPARLPNPNRLKSVGGTSIITLPFDFLA